MNQGKMVVRTGNTKELINKTMKTKTKIGIADAHGIESYKNGTIKQAGLFALRARLNRQRHAVCYEATVSEKTDRCIETLIKKHDFIGALIFLKEHASNINLATGMGNVQESFNLIPNPKLDPYN